MEKRGPKKPPCSRSPEPHTADDGEGGAKTEGPQPHERWHSRKRKTLADHIGMPLLSQLVLSSDACGERQVQRVATCLHTVLQFAQEETSSQTRGSDPHSDHRRTSKEHRRDRVHGGGSKEDSTTLARRAHDRDHRYHPTGSKEDRTVCISPLPQSMTVPPPLRTLLRNPSQSKPEVRGLSPQSTYYSDSQKSSCS